LIFFDKLKTGGNVDRDGLWDAIENLGRGDVLVVYNLERLARSVYYSHILERDIKKQGAAFVSTLGEGTWNDVDTPEDKCQRNMLRVFGEYNREASNARTSAAMRRHMRKGIKMGGKVPYGLMVDPADKTKMIPNPDEQKIIERIKKLRIDEKLNFRQIARRLKAEGIKARLRVDKKTPEPRHSKWHHSLIKNILLRADVK